MDGWMDGWRGVERGFQIIHMAEKKNDATLHATVKVG